MKKSLVNRLHTTIEAMDVNEDVRKYKDAKMRSVIEAPHETRTRAEIKLLVDFVKQVKFFKDQNLRDADLVDILPHLLW